MALLSPSTRRLLVGLPLVVLGISACDEGTSRDVNTASDCFNPELLRNGSTYGYTQTPEEPTSAPDTTRFGDSNDPLSGPTRFEVRVESDAGIEFGPDARLADTRRHTRTYWQEEPEPPFETAHYIQAGTDPATGYRVLGQRHEGGLEGPTIVTHHPARLIRHDLQEGDSYTQALVTSRHMPHGAWDSHWTITTTYRGRKTVEVPAGRFETCLIVQRYEAPSDRQTDGAPYSLRMPDHTLYQWQAVGSGIPVMTQVEGHGFAETRWELTGATINGRPIDTH
ncbi:hypothetical protein [Thioalkalivibrio sp. ALMg3]|uniref:hypothetical protein n=1 Tax=Thioalkalivibrio sp. ALMg3 TaxID=1158163 RepID=UPI0012DF14E8|nr:hypothetical protein [Thioalkalivibrio sp. ALMg3]